MDIQWETQTNATVFRVAEENIGNRNDALVNLFFLLFVLIKHQATKFMMPSENYSTVLVFVDADIHEFGL